MLTITALKSNSPSGDGGGVPKYLTATEYYLDKNGQERSSAAWTGRGAQALGLKGPVTEELMNKLAAGFGPDGQPLRQNAGEKPKQHPLKDRQGNVKLDEQGNPIMKTQGVRIGFDLTWSAPKSVSVAFAGADGALRDKMLEAHHAAVEKALDFVEKHAAETRRGKGGKDVLEAELVISRHTHYGARAHEKDWKQRGEHELDVDPQLHTHCLVYNLARDKDGNWGALEPKEMYHWKMAAGALYRAELAENLRGLGFGIEDDIRLADDGSVKDRFFKIAGVPDELAEQMSGRRKEILAHMAEHGGSAQQANLATRRDKDEPTFAELSERWKEDLAEYRREHPGLLPENMRSLVGRKPEREAPKPQQELDQEILAELHETKSVWTRADLTGKLAERNVGRMSMKDVLKETSQFLVRNDLVLIEPEKVHQDDRGQHLARRHREVRFADPKVVAQEHEMVRDAAARKGEQEVRLDPKVVDQAIAAMEKERGFQLSAEQRKAARFVCAETGGVAVIEGRAGTGKTTTADAVVQAYEASGRHVIGAATGWDAAKKLEAESGITSHSITSLLGKLDKGQIKLNSKSVILIDEAGMVGTPSMKGLLDHAHAAKAKVLLQGDTLQLQSVERGAPMRALAKEVGSVVLTDIRRQQHQADRDTAQAFYDAGDAQLRSRQQNVDAGKAILSRMERNGQIQGYDSWDEARQQWVAQYLASQLPARDKLLTAGTREDVQAGNSAVREVRKRAGELGLEFQIQGTEPRTGKAYQIPLAEGDRVRFTKRNDELGLVNGTKAVVQSITPAKGGGHTIKATIESDIKKMDGREVEFNTKDYGCLTHAYAATVHKSQGQSVQEVYHLGHPGMTDRQLSLVSFTRMKQKYELFGDASDLFDVRLDAKVAEDRLQMNAMEEGRAFEGRTTKQVMADLARQKARAAHEALIAQRQEAQKPEPVAQPAPPKPLTRQEARETLRPQKPVVLEPEQKDLVQRAAEALKAMSRKVRERLFEKEREARNRSQGHGLSR